MIQFKKYLDIKYVSLLLVVLPYLLFHWNTIYCSPFFTYLNLAYLVFILIAIEFVFKYFIIKYNKGGTLMVLILLFVVLFIFYGIVISTYLTKYIASIFNIVLRGRTLAIICLCLLFFFVFKIRAKNFSYRIFNVFLLIFSLVTFICNFRWQDESIDIRTFKNNYLSIVDRQGYNKPVVLIITDEYSAPTQIFNVTKDSSVFSFANTRIKHGWIVRDNFHSFEKSSIHSFSSLINFNLSVKSNYRNQSIPDAGFYKLLRSSLFDSLVNKRVDIINFGIFNVGKSEPLTRLYFYPKNFMETILMFTSYYLIKFYTGGIEFGRLIPPYYPADRHHEHIFNNLADTLTTIKNRKTFIYVHLLMPHSPFRYKGQFSLQNSNSFNSYLNYWNFTNDKIESLLTKLQNDNKYKIILTGDHGYRNDSRINAHKTFCAFYGFKQSEISQIKSVQDLGSLVNSSF